MATRAKQQLVFSLSERHKQVILAIILIVSFGIRIFRIDQPKSYMFDEVYHAVTAKLMANNDPRAYEWWNPAPEPNTAVDWLHPPLAKHTQAFFMNILGENSIGWRMSSVLFGVGVIWLTYRLASAVFGHDEIGLLAAGLAGLDGLLLAQSRIAMNDIHVTFFILLALLLYWRHRAIGTTFSWQTGTAKRILMIGLAAGLAMASKWSGLFVLILISGFESWSLLAASTTIMRLQGQKQKVALKAWFRTVALSIVAFAIVPIAVYVADYLPMFLQGKTLYCGEEKAIQGQCYYEQFKWQGKIWHEAYVSHFTSLHRQIWWYQTNLDATHPYQSRPWQWFFNLKPVWFHVDYVDKDHVANIYAMGNTMLFWFGGASMIFSALMLASYGLSTLAKNKVTVIDQTTAFRLLYLVAAYCIVWLPWVASPRIMFFYHYTPAVPLMSITLAYYLWQMLQRRTSGATLVAGTIMGLIIINFVVWFPHFTGLTVPKSFADRVYFSLKTWK